MQDKLNTMDSFENEGFKIERNGQMITLTQDEMCRFRKLESAIDDRSCFEHFIECETELDLINKAIERSKNVQQIVEGSI